MNTTEQNKAIVTRFNKEFIEQGNTEVFEELIAPNVINHTAPAGSDNGKSGMFFFLNNMLRAGFPDIKLEIHDQIAEEDRVTTRKTFYATHTGTFMGIPATGKEVAIQVIDIIRLKDGQYTDHWGMSNLPEVIAELSGK